MVVEVGGATVVAAGVRAVVVVGGTVVVVVVGGTVVVVDVVVELAGVVVVVVDPVVVESEAGGSGSEGADAFAVAPPAVRAVPASAPTDSGTTSMVVSRRRRWDTGGISRG